MIRFISMRIENFLSFSETEVDLDDQGLTLIEGENRDDESAISNGAGKSALVDALVWCLYGTTLRGYENDEVINRRVGDDCLVSVFVETDSGSYAINRARRHSKFKNRLSVTNDLGEDASGPSNAETQLVVEKLLGCSLRTFLSSVIFGQDRAYRFSSLTDKEQKDVLDEVLGVERFARACAEARQLSSACDSAASSTAQALDRARAADEQAAEELDELLTKDDNFERDRAARVVVETSKLEAARARAEQAVDVDVDQLRAELDTEREVYEADDERIVSISKKVSALYRDCESARTKAATLAAMVKSLSSKTCPTCGQSIRSTGNVGDFKTELSDARDSLADLETAYGAADLSEKKLRAAHVKHAAVIKEAEKKILSALSAEADAKAFRLRVDDHARRIKEIEAETNPYASMIEKAEKKMAKWAKERQLLAVQHDAEQARLKVAQFWVEAFGTKGLRSLLLDTSLPILNAEARRISNAVTGGSISIEFSATSDLKNGKTVDKFEVRVDNKHGADSYRGNSAGERAKVDLCVGLAIQKLVASRSTATFNVAAFDEVFDHLDSAAHERVIEVLSEIDKETILIISHNEDLKAFFPNTWTVLKKNGFSEVVQ